MNIQEQTRLNLLDSLYREMARAEMLDSSLIFSEGTSAGLLAAQERLQADLQSQSVLIKELQSSATATQTTLQSDLEKLRRENTISEQRMSDLQNGYRELIENFNDQPERVVADLLTELDTSLSSQGLFQMKAKPGLSSLIVPEGYLFRAGSSSRMTSGYEVVLSAVSRALEGQPLLKMRVEGHTDTETGRIDNWTFAANRAAKIADLLADEFYLSPSRFSAASYGQYAPLASNSTAEGKAINRRIEFVFYQDVSVLSRAFEDLSEQMNAPD